MGAAASGLGAAVTGYGRLSRGWGRNCHPMNPRKATALAKGLRRIRIQGAGVVEVSGAIKWFRCVQKAMDSSSRMLPVTAMSCFM